MFWFRQIKLLTMLKLFDDYIILTLLSVSLLTLRPKIKRCLFDLARPTGKNRADSENFIAVFRPFFFALEFFFSFRPKNNKSNP